MRLLYRVLLLAYPRRFRAEYGGLMWEMFRIQYHRASADPGALGRFRFWLFAIDDLARNALSERAGRWSQGHRPLIAPLAKSQRSRTPLPSPSLSIGLEMIQDLLTEARHAVRRLAQSPSFSLLAILITALGIGANSAMFSFINAILLRPPAYERADEVVAVYQDSDDGEPNSSSFPAFRDIQSYDEIFSETIALLPFGASLVTDDGVEPLATEWVTAGYFSFLGLAPTMGRDFGPQDDVDGGEPVAVLSYAMWQERYGSDPDILGERLNVNGAPVTIVGVGPQGYGGILPGFQLDTWLSISAMRPAMGAGAAATLERRADHWFQLRARLADGVTTARAQSAMDQLAERLAADYPEYNAGREITVFEPGGIRIHPDIDGQLMPLSVRLMVVVALVLFIACSNLASLLLLRGYGRAQDVAIRLALGASRMRVVCHVVTESVLLSVAGGAVGLALAMWATRAFASIDLSLPLPGAVDLRLDWRVVAFTMALSLLTGVLFGLLPGLRIARSNAMERLRDDAASMSLRGNRFNLRNLLVVGQVAVSFVILVAAGLFLRSLGNAQQAPLGFDSGRLALISTNAAFSEYSAEEGAPLLEQLRDRIAALPGVEEAALTAQPPVRGTGGSSTLVVEGYTPPTGTDAVEVMRSSVGPRYFSTIGAPITPRTCVHRGGHRSGRAGRGRVGDLRPHLLRHRRRRGPTLPRPGLRRVGRHRRCGCRREDPRYDGGARATLLRRLQAGDERLRNRPHQRQPA